MRGRLYRSSVSLAVFRDRFVPRQRSGSSADGQSMTVSPYSTAFLFLLGLAIIKLMDFVARRVTVAMAVLFARRRGCYAVFTAKDALFFVPARSHYRKIERFRRKTSNRSEDSTVCTASDCYAVFTAKESILPFYSLPVQQ